MNKIILLLLSLMFFTDMSFAQNNLTVFSEDGLPFYLILNGIRQNEQPETNVRLENLSADYYTSKIIFNDGSLGEIEKKFLNVTSPECKPCDVTYKIKYSKKGELVMKPFNFSSLATAPPPPANVTVVNYNTAPMPPPVIGMQVTETTTTHSTGTSDNVSMGVNVGGFNMGVNVNVNDGYGGSTTHTSTTTTTTTMPTQTVVVEEVGCPPMSSSSYSALLNSVNSKSFGDDKLAVAKQATRSNCLSVNQIIGVMNTFDFEDNRMEFAKHAYNSCSDPQNYFQVNDAFEFESSIEELDEYIGGR